MKKKKIALFTIQSKNYGNRLQNYATQEILERMNYKVLTFHTDDLFNDIREFKEFHPSFSGVSNKLVYVIIAVRDFIKTFIRRDMNTNFVLFNKKIHFSTDYISTKGWKIKNLNKYSAIIVGSDQVWNTHFTDVVSLNSFLPFYFSKKVAFSVSFGFDAIDYCDEIKTCISDFSAISVREERGRDILKCLIKQDVQVLIDPTLMLSAEEWRRVEKKPKEVNKSDYIYAHFLSEPIIYAKDFIAELDDRHIVIGTMLSENKMCNNAGPAEFLWLCDNAKMILTDSFHACVFAFIFGIPFVVFDRSEYGKKMNSRLDTFLKKFNLEAHYYNGNLTDCWDCNYEEKYKKLKYERRKVVDFLRNAIES